MDRPLFKDCAGGTATSAKRRKRETKNRTLIAAYFPPYFRTSIVSIPVVAMMPDANHELPFFATFAMFLPEKGHSPLKTPRTGFPKIVGIMHDFS